MKEKPAKTFNRRIDVADLLDRDETVNIDAALNGRFKFIVTLNNKFVARNYQGPRFIVVEKPYSFSREAEAYEAARSFKGTKVIKEAQNDY